MKKFHNATKKAIVAIMSAAMVTGLFGGIGIGNTYTAKAKDYGISNPRISEDGSVTWDKIKFGSYKQSVEFGEPEPIKWRILSVDEDNNALLLADKGLDCKPYNEKGIEKIDEMGIRYTDYSCTWETSTLRTWLNEEFIKEAFSESEQAAIKQVTVKNDDNPECNTEGGNDTTDKVYLLSIEEVSNSEYGFDSTFDVSGATKTCKVTEYAYLNGDKSAMGGNGYWWLRSPGGSSGSAAFVDYDGWCSYYGYYVNRDGYTIRPALQINLSSSLVKDAGETMSDGTVTDTGDGYNNPKVTDNGTVWDCVYFGRYKQNISAMEKEPIEWRVLSVDGDEALLLADKGLDCKPYNEEGIEKIDEDGGSYIDYSCTWETCTLRTWLNNDFYKEAFTESEQAAIKQVTVKNDDNPMYGTEGGNDTSDKVYLLSTQEASNSTYGFNSSMNINSDTRECKATDYARINGVWRSSSLDNVGNGCWWLRSPGNNSDYAASLDIGGWGSNNGSYVHISSYAIRPALRINLSSSVWEAAGTVSTGAGNIDPDQPTQTPEPTDVPQSTATPEASNTPDVTQAPTSQPATTPITTTATQTPTPDIINAQVTTSDSTTKLKSIKLTSVKCKKGTKQISGKVSVSGATVKIKVGSKAYRKATVKGKKFTLKVPRLNKNTKVTIKVTKSGYKNLVKLYKAK